jgi:hypothetical protein
VPSKPSIRAKDTISSFTIFRGIMASGVVSGEFYRLRVKGFLALKLRIDVCALRNTRPPAI